MKRKRDEGEEGAQNGETTNTPNGSTKRVSQSLKGPEIDIEHTLQTVFKKDSFRGCQKEIIETVLNGKDALVLLPTGHGKSLTFQLPAVATPKGVTLVVSPLLALMANQVQALQKLKISAETLNSDIMGHERRRILQDIVSARPKTRLLYLSPEYISNQSFQRILQTLHRQKLLERFVIDEAHCCVEWGHSFRSTYKELGFLRKTYPNVPITALTATASESVQKGIIDIMGLNSETLGVFTTSINRANLHYEVRYLVPDYRYTDSGAVQEVILADIQEFLDEYKGRRQVADSQCPGSGIIYCRTRALVERVADELKKKGYGAHAFHAGMDIEVRGSILKRWTDSKPGYEIVVATIAFGMGVDKPNVRFVINFDLPDNLESYYQLSGRAGRDNKGARCIIYYCSGAYSPTANADIRQYCGKANQCRHVSIAEHFEPHLTKTVRDRAKMAKEYCQFACDVCKNKKFVSSRYMAMKRAVDSLTEGIPSTQATCSSNLAIK